MTKNITSILKTGLALSSDISRLSQCKIRKVGCVLSSLDFDRWCIGYNSVAKGLSHEKYATEKNCKSSSTDVHAEINAIINCDFREEKKIAFISYPPCTKCCFSLVNFNVKMIFYNGSYTDKKVMKGVHILNKEKLVLTMSDTELNSENIDKIIELKLRSLENE